MYNIVIKAELFREAKIARQIEWQKHLPSEPKDQQQSWTFL